MAAKHNSSGSKAEKIVAEMLLNNGYKIIDKNWKTKWCEIDIVAEKNGVMHFVEVKYRGSSYQGGGFDYITAKKMNQMRRAADSYVMLHNWSGPYVLSAAEVSGDDFKIEFLDEI